MLEALEGSYSLFKSVNWFSGNRITQSLSYLYASLSGSMLCIPEIKIMVILRYCIYNCMSSCSAYKYLDDCANEW